MGNNKSKNINDNDNDIDKLNDNDLDITVIDDDTEQSINNKSSIKNIDVLSIKNNKSSTQNNDNNITIIIDNDTPSPKLSNNEDTFLIKDTDNYDDDDDDETINKQISQEITIFNSNEQKQQQKINVNIIDDYIIEDNIEHKSNLNKNFTDETIDNSVSSPISSNTVEYTDDVSISEDNKEDIKKEDNKEEDNKEDNKEDIKKNVTIENKEDIKENVAIENKKTIKEDIKENNKENVKEINKINVKIETKKKEDNQKDSNDDDIYNQTYDRFGFVITENATNDSKKNRHVNQNIIETSNQKNIRILLERSRESKWINIVNDWEENNKLTKKNEKLFKKRIYKGIPESFRGRVWYLLLNINNKRKKDKYLYQRLLTSSIGLNTKIIKKKEINLENKQTKIIEEIIEESKLSNDIENIKRDLNRTFPDHFLFQKSSYGQESLLNILKAYAVFDPEIGYCQGMGFVAGLLLNYVDEESVFWMLTTLMQNKKWNMRLLYDIKMSGSQLLLQKYEELIKKYLPKIYNHINNEGIISSMYASHWFITILTYSFPFPIVLRCWDIFLYDGWIIVFQILISMLKIHEKQILSKNFENLLMYFKIMPSKLNVNILMKKVNEYRIIMKDEKVFI